MFMVLAVLGLAGAGYIVAEYQLNKSWKEDNDEFHRYIRKQYGFMTTSSIDFGRRSYIAFDDGNKKLLIVNNGLKKIYEYQEVTYVRYEQPNTQAPTVNVEIDVSDTKMPMLSLQTNRHKGSFILAKIKAHLKHLSAP